MRDTPAPWKHGVVLVCNNQRPDGAPKPSCGRMQGESVKAWLKPRLRELDGPAGQCRVLTTSCLDVCPRDGVAVALLPGNEVVVVDPVADREALEARIVAHMDQVAQDKSPGGRGRRLLGKLRGRQD